MTDHKLYGRAGWGSVLVEAQLRWYKLSYELVEVDDLFKSAAARAALARINPLAQIPTLILPDGSTLTESAAITLYLADLAQSQSKAPTLVPQPPGAQRNAFLRWLVFVVANIYPTFTYADDPARFVAVDSAQAAFLDSVSEYAQTLYRQLNSVAGSPWFLGETFSALDIYLCTLVRWRPGVAWFREQTPALFDIARGADDIEVLRPVWQRNFSSARRQLR